MVYVNEINHFQVPFGLLSVGSVRVIMMVLVVKLLIVLPVWSVVLTGQRMFDEADFYATLLANGTWAVPVIVATEKKGGYKDTIEYLGKLTETVSHLENPQNTIGWGEYQSVTKRDP